MAVHSEAMKCREILRLIEADGWTLVAERGSHRLYQHPSKRGRVTVVAEPADDVPKWTAANILRHAALRGTRR